MSKKTVILGATTNPERYAYIAANRLLKAGHEIVPVGIKKGEVFGHKILDVTSSPMVDEVDTITMYVGPQHQKSLYDYITQLHPKRVVFNPGSENPELEELLRSEGVEVVEGCTLVMLSTNQY
ncbi:MAG: CoA-binding protein [Imperialibacter sp.]|uniref:CoA-binding protein n=1 Tax=Imperialibacter sp. TaxID=2038411 RepID=UPI0032EE135B